MADTKTLRTDACPRCKGTGEILVGMFSEPGKQRESTCNVCNGKGVLRDLEAEVADLTAKLAAERERVDWLEKEGTLWNERDGSMRFKVWTPTAKTLREGIDAAIREAEEAA